MRRILLDVDAAAPVGRGLTAGWCRRLVVDYRRVGRRMEGCRWRRRGTLTLPDAVRNTPTTRSQEPVTVRLIRHRVRQLREAAQTDEDEKRRRRLARALANLAY